MKKGIRLAGLLKVTTIWVTRGHPDWFLEKVTGQTSFALLTCRDFGVWLDNPYEVPPIVPDAEQLSLAVVWLDSIQKPVGRVMWFQK